ncbi:PLAC8 family protein [Euphorbia peplus]|nr:PLAC8 family protein [Euphorbia peplus]
MSLLFCTAPFWIIYSATVNIVNETIREALGLIGVILCVFGLLYGGFSRIRMRERFHLPTYTFCFGKPSASDCMLWLRCCWCSLAQEVETGYSDELRYRTVTDHKVRKKICSLWLWNLFPARALLKSKLGIQMIFFPHYDGS